MVNNDWQSSIQPSCSALAKAEVGVNKGALCVSLARRMHCVGDDLFLVNHTHYRLCNTVFSIKRQIKTYF